MPWMSHCIIRRDGGLAGDTGALEINHSQVFSVINASLDDLGDQNVQQRKDPMMSYPSVNKHLEAQGATLEMASEAQMASAFLAAFREDLPLGMTRVDELAGKTKYWAAGDGDS